MLSVRLLGFLSCGEMANRLEVIAYMVVGCVIAARLPVRERARAVESNLGSQMERQRGPKYASLWTSIDLNRRQIQRFRFYNAAFCAVVFYYFITF